MAATILSAKPARPTRAQKCSKGENMSKSKNRSESSRRDFLKTAGATAGAALIGESLWRQGMPVAAAAKSGLGFPKIDQKMMLAPEQALEWASFKAKCGPTWAGSAGWKQFTDFLTSKMPQFGGVDLDYVEIPYDHYLVDDWPDRRTHMHDSGVAVEKLVTDGTPVPVVASYGMTSGSTPPEGLTAPMVYYDPANPPSDAQIAGKMLVFQTDPYPNPPYTNAFLDSYTMTDYEWRSPGKWGPLFEPVPTSVTTSYHSRWTWNQIGQAARIGIKGHAAGIVVVYDLSPGAAFGLTQRSVYTPDGKAGLGAKYVNCPTLALDRVNGAKVLADAKAGKTATLTLIARFQRDTGKAIIAYLPGKITARRRMSRSCSPRTPTPCPWSRKSAGWACWPSCRISIKFRRRRGHERWFSISIAGISCRGANLPGRSSITTIFTRIA